MDARWNKFTEQLWKTSGGNLMSSKAPLDNVEDMFIQEETKESQ